MTGEGQQQAFQAALAANQQQYQDVLSGRQSYFSGGPAMSQAQNQAAINQGIAVENADLQNASMENQYNLGVGGLQNQYSLGAAGMLNNYNLASTGMQNQYGLNTTGMANNFNQANFQDQLQAYQAQNQFWEGLLGGSNLNNLAKAGSTLQDVWQAW